MKKRLLIFIFAFLSAGAVPAPAADYIVKDPAPDERAKYQFPRETGKLKRTALGLIDPSPDVISLKFLPKDRYGFVDWMKAVNTKVIKPRDEIGVEGAAVSEANNVEYDKDVLIRSKLDFMPDVIFPHSAHNAWLKCSICHPKIFKMKAGANPISMVGIWQGDFCGRCHDRVAFPVRNCYKCHTAPREKKTGAQAPATDTQIP
ncbi:MAG: hypothetical protein HZB82_09675 [Deltaproteobacteria bacterium]|nr:hypothetical protein [Deltaproteobacteria bacterium]